MPALGKTNKKPPVRGARGPREDAFTVSIFSAGQILGKSLNATYLLVQKGDIQTVFGNRVLKSWLAETLGVSIEAVDERLAQIAQRLRA